MSPGGGAAGAASEAPESVLVTGAHGLLGAWLTGALLDAGHRVVAVRRDEPAVSTLALMGRAGEVDTVHGDICEEGLVARALNEYDVSSVFHLAAQTQVGTANRSPRSQTRQGALPACQRSLRTTASL